MYVKYLLNGRIDKISTFIFIKNIIKVNPNQGFTGNKKRKFYLTLQKKTNSRKLLIGTNSYSSKTPASHKMIKTPILTKLNKNRPALPKTTASNYLPFIIEAYN